MATVYARTCDCCGRPFETVGRLESGMRYWRCPACRMRCHRLQSPSGRHHVTDEGALVTAVVFGGPRVAR